MNQGQPARAPFAPSGSLGIDGAICQRILSVALERGGDYADLFFEYRDSFSLSFEEGITRNAAKGVSMGVGVRVCHGEATGYAHTEDLSFESMKRAAETAGKIAESKSGLSPVTLIEKIVPRRYDLDRFSIDQPGLGKRELLERAQAAALLADPRVSKFEASYVEELREILVVTSDGIVAFDQQPMIRFGCRAVVEIGDKRESGRSGGGGRMTLGYFDVLSPEHHAREAVRQATVLLEAQPAPAGQMEVVLSPGDSGILLHEAVGHGLEADFNRKGTSNYSGRVGQVVSSELCTVVDDASLLQGRGSINIDDEGHVPDKQILIEDGVLRGYMQDRLSAKHFDVAASGNGRRESFADVPLPRMTNTILLAGPHDPEEIVRSVKKGVYASAFGGGQVDIANGDFVFSLTESYLIEDGRLTAPLKGVNLIGNGPETLAGVSMLGHDLTVSDGIWTCGKAGQSVPVGVGCPTVKLARVTVGGTRID